MNHNQLLLALYKIGAIQFGHFTLKSGLTSSVYIDLRQIVSYPVLLREVAHAIWDKIQNHAFDIICGVPYTALPIATCLSLEQNMPMVLRRKEKKTYGTKQTIEGHFNAGQSCLIIEDIITTGSSILETAEDLEAVQLHISDIVVFIDREQGGKENLSAYQYRMHTVFTLSEVFRHLLNSGILTEVERDIVNQLLLERV